MKEAVWENNLKFVKDVTTINVNVIETKCSCYGALLLYHPSYHRGIWQEAPKKDTQNFGQLNQDPLEFQSKYLQNTRL